MHTQLAKLSLSEARERRWRPLEIALHSRVGGWFWNLSQDGEVVALLLLQAQSSGRREGEVGG